MKNKFTFLILSFMLFFNQAHAEFVEVEVKTVTYKNLVAKLFLPKVIGTVPAVIAFGGSDGGMNFAEANGAMIAPHGIAVLGIAYFKEPGLPDTLDHIPIEYFINAIDYLETLPAVDGNRIGVVSGSRGSEAAFLLASMDRRIKSLAVTTPSEVAWYGMTSAQSAWTYNGMDIPALSLEPDETLPKLSRFEAALANQKLVRNSLFAFEKVNGPILMVSAENDQIWPSYAMSKDIEAYLKGHHFNYAVTHRSYPTGHMFTKETAPEIRQLIIDHFLQTLQVGCCSKN